ncbi:MAG: ComEC/Rec2 family competence protein [Aristaeellaceae bacterium]
MMKRFVTLLLLLLLAVPASAEDAPPILVDRINAPEEHADFAFAEDAPLLEVIFPQILNCDAALLRCGGETLLVDCATQGQAVRIINMCKQLGITHIDRVLNTHPHADHIGGLNNLMKEVTVGELWICFPADYNNHMKNAVAAAERAGVPVRSFADGDVLTLGGATIEVWKLDGRADQLNDCSAQLLVTYGERTMLMAADLEAEGQKQMVALHGDKLDADILKYPHHGIDVLREDYKAAVSPLFLVVTNNHRQTAGWKAIQRGDIPFAYTVPGFVCAFTDGTTWLTHRIPSEIKY